MGGAVPMQGRERESSHNIFLDSYLTLYLSIYLVHIYLSIYDYPSNDLMYLSIWQKNILCNFVTYVV